ncbi:DUF2442 [Desulfonema limicola]|uniref:DUF2442 n=1 Tax=Desulfonema limicola TaxID=45656 RepID=A0A975B6F0_9BACT|nr:DUF2442 domain-containing protein [Desulfonema limicola]QTA79651.1 DUF2442 [Desulfonema limicola]
MLQNLCAGAYTLSVELSDGRFGIFDVKPYLEKGVFRQLKDKDYFKKD